MAELRSSCGCFGMSRFLDVLQYVRCYSGWLFESVCHPCRLGVWHVYRTCQARVPSIFRRVSGDTCAAHSGRACLGTRPLRRADQLSDDPPRPVPVISCCVAPNKALWPRQRVQMPVRESLPVWSSTARSIHQQLSTVLRPLFRGWQSQHRPAWKPT